MDWESLRFGIYNREQVQRAVADPKWQRIRISIKGASLQSKYDTLVGYLEDEGYSKGAMTRVTNYVNALRRGGLI